MSDGNGKPPRRTIGPSAESALAAAMMAQARAEEALAFNLAARRRAADAELPDGLLSPEQASEMIGVSLATLARWRCLGAGLPFYKLNARRIVYGRADVLDWLKAHRRAG